MSPVNLDDYDDVVSKINAKYEGDIKRGDEIDNPIRIGTGSLALDLAMGGDVNGVLGWPWGRWVRLYGQYSSTKSLTAWNTIRACQQAGYVCCYYNVEKQYHPDFVHNLGVDIDELTVIDGTTIEEIGEKMEAMLGVAHVHVIDSCSLAVSEDVLEAPINAWRPGIDARAWGKVFKRLNERFDYNDNFVMLLDQIRTTGMMQGKAQQSPTGGNVFDHQSSMSVAFRRGGWLFYDEKHGYLSPDAKKRYGMGGDMQPDGIEIKARVEKSRISRPLIPAGMRLDLNTFQFDRIYEYAEAAKFYGALTEIRAGGNYYYEAGGSRIHMRGDKQLRDFIEGDVTFQEHIRDTAAKAVAHKMKRDRD